MNSSKAEEKAADSADALHGKMQCSANAARSKKGVQDQRRDSDLYAITYVDVFGQQLVGHFVLVQDVVVDACAGECGTEEETKEAGGSGEEDTLARLTWRKGTKSKTRQMHQASAWKGAECRWR